MPRTPRPEISATPQAALKLPKHMQLSTEELAIVARLIRVIRERGYWLGAFIDWALQADAASADGVKVDTAKDMLEKISGLNTWANWFETAENEHNPILRYYGHRYFEDDVDRIQNENWGVLSGDEPEQFCELERQWRIEHPEPTKPQHFPAGHLGQEESGD
jgi:hypothetical protein